MIVTDKLEGLRIFKQMTEKTRSTQIKLKNMAEENQEGNMEDLSDLEISYYNDAFG